MKPTLQLHIGQQLSMTPQLQQAIRLLQLSSVDLEKEIQSTLEKNPMLEIESESQNNSAQTNDIDSSETELRDDLTSLEPNFYDTKHDNRMLCSSKKYDSTTDNPIERLVNYDTTLHEHLIWQMQLTPFTLSEKLIAITIIDATNKDGYLTSTVEDIYQTLKNEIDIEVKDVTSVLSRIQLFDPVGVSARNLKECINIQLNALCPTTPWRNKAIELATSYLPLLAKKNYAALRRYLSLSLEDLKKVVQLIQGLNPRPGRKIGSSSPQYIIPDVYVKKRSNQWIVEINPNCTPSLHINPQYAALIRHSNNSRDTQYFKEQLKEARWFLKSLENRNETLIKVTKSIIKAQIDFFEQGEIGMKPLILHQIAEEVGMHESTISRITNQKFMHTPRGIFELKYFFSSHVRTINGGECSAIAIRALIKKLIADENHLKPFSDEQLTKLLGDKGIQVARRTVTKYRETMTIPSSTERKKFF